MTRTLSSLVVLVLSACASDFSPNVVAGTMTSADPTEDPAEDDSSVEPDDSSSSDSSGESTTGDDSTSDGTTTGDPGDDSSDSGTVQPEENPGPGEPCDPFEAFDGTKPCDGDPETPSVAYTCVPAMLEPVPDEIVWEFRCVAAVDVQGDGEELGDPCSDDAGSFFAGCMNSHCLSNGLFTSPEQDVYENHPPVPSDDACPFIWWSADDPTHAGAGYYVKGCCSNFCDANHPCDVGWTCEMGDVLASLNGEAVGACVWQ